MAKFLIVLSVLISLSAFAEKHPFERYQPIIDRQMFGQPPIGFDPTKMASEVSKSAEKELTKEQEEIKSSIHFSIINVTPSGKTAVGFTDNSDAKTPVHYYLKVGESAGGWTLKDADALKAWMKIEKNGIEVELTLGQNSAKGGGTTSKAGSGLSAKASTMDLKPKTGSGARSTLLGRRAAGGGLRDINQLRAERQAQREAAEAKAAEERAKQEAERDEMRASLAEMKEQLAEQRKLREEAEANSKAREEAKGKGVGQGEDESRSVGEEQGRGQDNEGDENEENND